MMGGVLRTMLTLLVALAVAGLVTLGCNEQAEPMSGSLVVDAVGGDGRLCELDGERSSDRERHWICEMFSAPVEGKGDGDLAPEGSGGTHWSCVELEAEGSGGTHWFCVDEDPNSGVPSWDCMESDGVDGTQTLWECVPSAIPWEEQVCTSVSLPPADIWTPDFEYRVDCVDCVNGSGVGFCRSLYRGRVDSVSGNMADLSFMKTTGEGPSVAINYWVLAVSGESLVCSEVALDALPVRALGVWQVGDELLQVTDVPIWGDEAAYAAASSEDTVRLARVTGGGDEPTVRRWYQPEAFVFHRVCLP